MSFHFQKQTFVHSHTAFRNQTRTDYRQTAHGLAKKTTICKVHGLGGGGKKKIRQDWIEGLFPSCRGWSRVVSAKLKFVRRRKRQFSQFLRSNI